MNRLKHSSFIGILLVTIGATLWGVSGTVAQYLFHTKGINTEWLVTVRLLFSGLLLLLFGYLKEGKSVYRIWRTKKDAISLILFSILGMLAVQYTYFAAIEHGNAATATVLQYTAPVMITCFLIVRYRKLPSGIEITAVFVAVLGTFSLVTQGNINSLSISPLALFWGLLSAVSLAFYTLHPHKLLANWGSVIVVGWGMFVGGVVFSFIHTPWDFRGEASLTTILAILFIILFGTLVAFVFYLESLKYIGATKASILANFEPLSAALLAVLWLNVPFGVMEWIGTFCILGTVGLLSMVKKEKP
nr:EamA family transporter [Salinibacillus xinjiangensis]